VKFSINLGTNRSDQYELIRIHLLNTRKQKQPIRVVIDDFAATQGDIFSGKISPQLGVASVKRCYLGFCLISFQRKTVDRTWPDRFVQTLNYRILYRLLKRRSQPRNPLVQLIRQLQ